MARLEPSWNDAYLAAIARSESERGRVICGHPLEDGTPCAAEPLASGRCVAHGAPLAAAPPKSAIHDVGHRALLWVAIGIVLSLLTVGIIHKFLHDPAEEIWREAASLMAMGESAHSRALFEVLVRDYPTTPAGRRASALIGPRVGRRGTPAERLFREARNFYPLGAGSTHDLEEAVARYLSLADSHPTDPLTREALYEAARALDHLGRPHETIRTWERFIAAYPDDGRVPEALYAIGHLYRFQLGDAAAARKHFEDLIRNHPESNAAAAARILLEQDASGPASAAPPIDEAPSGPPTIHTPPGRLW